MMNKKTSYFIIIIIIAMFIIFNINDNSFFKTEIKSKTTRLNKATAPFKTLLTKVSDDSYKITDLNKIFTDTLKNSSVRYLCLDKKYYRFRVDYSTLNLFVDITTAKDSIIHVSFVNKFEELFEFITPNINSNKYVFSGIDIVNNNNRIYESRESNTYRFKISKEILDKIKEYPFKDNLSKKYIFELLSKKNKKLSILPADILTVIQKLIIQKKVKESKKILLEIKNIEFFNKDNQKILLIFHSELLKQDYLILYDLKNTKLIWKKKFNKPISSLKIYNNKIHIGLKSVTKIVSSKYFSNFEDNGSNVYPEFLIIDSNGKEIYRKNFKEYRCDLSSIIKVQQINYDNVILQLISNNKNIFVLSTIKGSMLLKQDGIIIKNCKCNNKNFILVNNNFDLFINEIKIVNAKIQITPFGSFRNFFKKYSLIETPLVKVKNKMVLIGNPFTVFLVDNKKISILHKENIFIKSSRIIENGIIGSKLIFSVEKGYQEQLLKIDFKFYSLLNTRLIIQLILSGLFIAGIIFVYQFIKLKNTITKNYNSISLFYCFAFVYIYQIKSNLGFQRFNKYKLCFSYDSFLGQIKKYKFNIQFKEKYSRFFWDLDEYAIIDTEQMEIFRRVSHDLKNFILNIKLDSKSSNQKLITKMSKDTILLSNFAVYLSGYKEYFDFNILLINIIDNFLFNTNFNNILLLISKEIKVYSNKKLLNIILNRIIEIILLNNATIIITNENEKMKIKIVDLDQEIKDSFKKDINILYFIINNDKIQLEILL